MSTVANQVVQDNTPAELFRSRLNHGVQRIMLPMLALSAAIFGCTLLLKRPETNWLLVDICVPMLWAGTLAMWFAVGGYLSVNRPDATFDPETKWFIRVAYNLMYVLAFAAVILISLEISVKHYNKKLGVVLQYVSIPFYCVYLVLGGLGPKINHVYVALINCFGCNNPAPARADVEMTPPQPQQLQRRIEEEVERRSEVERRLGEEVMRSEALRRELAEARSQLEQVQNPEKEVESKDAESSHRNDGVKTEKGETSHTAESSPEKDEVGEQSDEKKA